MLQTIHDHAQGWLAWLIVGLITIPFALWGVHEYMQPKQHAAVAEVNGVELSEAEFQNNLQQQKRQLRAMWQHVDLTSMEAQIKQSALSQMIEQEVLLQTAANSGLRISDTLLARDIHEIPTFQQDGVFSQVAYEQVLRAQGLSPEGFEAQSRRLMLVNQLRDGVVRSALLTKYDQQEQARLKEQQRSVSYVVIPASRFNDKVTVSDAEIDTYFKTNAKQFVTPEKVSVDYVEMSQTHLATAQAIDETTLKQRYEERIAAYKTPEQWHARHILVEVPKTATPADIETAKKKAQELLTKAKAGESFEELAKQFSSDKESAKKGGDLGWFKAGEMVKAFEDALKPMKVNDISELVKTDFGFHIIQMLEAKAAVTKTFEEVREELEKTVQKEQAETTFYAQVEQFANLAFQHPNTLDVLAETMKLPKKTTALFEHKMGAKDDKLLSNRKVIDAAFSDAVLKEGNNSELVELEPQHVVVLRVKDHEPSKPKLLAEVKEDIVKILKQQKIQAEAETLGKNLLEQLKQKNDPDTLLKTHELSWLPAQWIKRQDSTLKYTELVSEAFKLGRTKDNTALYQGIKLNNGDYALLVVLAVKDGVAPTTTPDKKDSKTPDPAKRAKTQQQQALGDSDFRQLVARLKATAQIKTYNDKL